MDKRKHAKEEADGACGQPSKVDGIPPFCSLDAAAAWGGQARVPPRQKRNSPDTPASSQQQLRCAVGLLDRSSSSGPRQQVANYLTARGGEQAGVRHVRNGRGGDWIQSTFWEDSDMTDQPAHEITTCSQLNAWWGIICQIGMHALSA